jgi:hypothetical protein
MQPAIEFSIFLRRAQYRRRYPTFQTRRPASPRRGEILL